MKGSGDKEFPVLDSGTSGLHVCSREVSIYCMGESWRFFTSPQDFFVSSSQSKEIELIKPFVSRAKAPSAKRSEKGYGDENGPLPQQHCPVLDANSDKIF